MPKANSLEAKLARLRSLRDEPVSDAAITDLKKALADSSNLVVAAAADVVGDKTVEGLSKDLLAAFERLMMDPEKSDKQCRGKIAVVEALNKIDYPGADVFLRGIAHVQDSRWEPSDPGQDAAGPLRAVSAYGLARMNHPDVLLLLADLLHDTDRAARAGAVRALGASGLLAAVPLLRFKTNLGDREPEIIGDCYTALLTLDFAHSLSFVSGFLAGGDPRLQETAVFALAETRRPEALAAVKDFWPKAPTALQESVLLAIAMFRLPAAIEFLTEIVSRRDPSARPALSALAIFRHHAKIRDAVAVAVTDNGDPGILQLFRKKFPEEGSMTPDAK